MNKYVPDCPVCWDPISSDDDILLYCPHCGRAYHRRCAAKIGNRCIIHGCRTRMLHVLAFLRSPVNRLYSATEAGPFRQCHECGHEMWVFERYCRECGSYVNPVTAQPPAHLHGLLWACGSFLYTNQFNIAAGLIILVGIFIVIFTIMGTNAFVTARNEEATAVALELQIRSTAIALDRIEATHIAVVELNNKATGIALEEQHATSIAATLASATVLAVQTSQAAATVSALQNQQATATAATHQRQQATATALAVQTRQAAATVAALQNQQATATSATHQSQQATATALAVQTRQAAATVAALQNQQATATSAATLTTDQLKEELLAKSMKAGVSTEYRKQVEEFIGALVFHLDEFRLPGLGVTKQTMSTALNRRDSGDRINALVQEVWNDWLGITNARGLNPYSADPAQRLSPFRQLVIKMIQSRQGQLHDAEQHALHNYFSRSEDSTVWYTNTDAVIGAVNRESFLWQ